MAQSQTLDGALRSRRNGHAARTALKSRATDVLDDFSELKKDVSRLADAANKAAREEVKFASKRLETLGRDVRGRANDSATYLADQVRERPGATIGVSLGAGLLLGLFLFRR